MIAQLVSVLTDVAAKLIELPENNLPQIITKVILYIIVRGQTVYLQLREQKLMKLFCQHHQKHWSETGHSKLSENILTPIIAENFKSYLI